MRKKLNLEGKRFGKLVAIEFSHSDKNKNSVWSCICDCGNETLVNSQRLITGKTKSCGCLKSESIIKRNI